MKVLVLGANSDEDADRAGGTSWLDVVRGGLAQMSPHELDFATADFRPFGVTAADYGAKRVEQADPDLLIVSIGSFWFTFGFVSVRLRRLFGQRAADFYKRLEDSFDRGTRRGGSLSVSANAFARRVVRAVVGAEPLATQAEVSACYRDLFRLLSHREHMHVVLAAAPGLGRHQRGAERKRAVFYRDLQDVARSHRYTWVNLRDAFPPMPDRNGILSVDGLHFSAAGNRVIGSTILDALATSTPEALWQRTAKAEASSSNA